jgi:hypothetical protein
MRLALLIATLTGAATSVLAQPAPVMKDVDPLDRAMTRHAYAIFIQHCPGLAKLAPLIEAINLRDNALVLDHDDRARGWTIAVAIEIKFRQTAADLAWDLGIGLMNDYLFLAGTGNEPGIASMATDGLRLCVPRYPSNFMPVPELRFLQRWPSEVADEKAHPHRNLDSSVYPLGDGPAILPTRP